MVRAVPAAQLRAEFARRMAASYGREVPAYNTLLDVASAVNAEVLARDGASAERLGSVGRVSAERHGAIRWARPGSFATWPGSLARSACIRSGSTTCAMRRVRRLR